MGRRATYGLFIHGLRSDIPTGKLKELIFVLLDGLNIPVKKSHISLVPQKHKKLAFVDLVSEENTDEAMRLLGSQERRGSLNLDFGIIAQDHNFYIKRILPRNGRTSDTKLIPNTSHDSMNINKTSSKISSQNPTTDASTQVSNSEMTSLDTRSSFKQDHDTSEQGIESSQSATKDIPGTVCHKATSVHSLGFSPCILPLDKGTSVQSFGNKGEVLDVATSVCGLDPVLQGRFYHYNEILGSETRNVEFKEGKGRYKSRSLTEHVGMYVCGFANTLEGGTLFIGVTDKGLAQGVICSHSEEDQIRLRIDDAVKAIEPSILPNMYSVAFTPVLNHGTFSENLRVIEVCVHPIKSHEELYEYRGKVFVRRDGSVQNFKPKDIKEWAKKKAARDNAESHSMRQQLDEVTNQLQEIQTHIQNIPAEKSKVCRIL